MQLLAVCAFWSQCPKLSCLVLLAKQCCESCSGPAMARLASGADFACFGSTTFVAWPRCTAVLSRFLRTTAADICIIASPVEGQQECQQR